MEEDTDTNVHTVQHTGCSSGMESRMCVGWLRTSNNWSDTQPTYFVLKKQEQVFSLKGRGEKQHPAPQQVSLPLGEGGVIVTDIPATTITYTMLLFSERI